MVFHNKFKIGQNFEKCGTNIVHYQMYNYIIIKFSGLKIGGCPPFQLSCKKGNLRVSNGGSFKLSPLMEILHMFD